MCWIISSSPICYRAPPLRFKKLRINNGRLVLHFSDALFRCHLRVLRDRLKKPLIESISRLSFFPSPRGKCLIQLFSYHLDRELCLRVSVYHWHPIHVVWNRLLEYWIIESVAKYKSSNYYNHIFIVMLFLTQLSWNENWVCAIGWCPSAVS